MLCLFVVLARSKIRNTRTLIVHLAYFQLSMCRLICARDTGHCTSFDYFKRIHQKCIIWKMYEKRNEKKNATNKQTNKRRKRRTID